MRLLGLRGEDAAARYLAKKGMKVLHRNWRCPAGEVDIIARDGETVVFVEVKARSTDRFGQAVESVGARKQKRITSAALLYIAGLKEEPPVRFDVVTVRGGLVPRVGEHIEDAFGLP